MKKNGILFSVVLLVLAGIVMTGCPSPNNTTAGGGDDDGRIPFRVKAEGTPTEKIVFTFGNDVSDLELDDIIITPKTGDAEGEELTVTDDEKVWELKITVTKAGDISVKIDKEGIATGSKSVTVTKRAVVTDPGNLGPVTYNIGSNDTAGSESQALWTVTGELYELLATPGTKLVVTFENEIAGGMQLIWQTLAGGWNDNNILESNGGAKPEFGTSVSDDQKTITIDLSLALKNYDTPTSGFLDATSGDKTAKIFLAYYNPPNKMRGLNVLKADLVEGTVVPIVESVTVSPDIITVEKGGTRQFTATITGKFNPATTVTWTIETTGKDAGTTISTAGLLTVAAEETLTSLTVKATSTVDNTKSGTATVTISAEAPTVTSVTVAPAAPSVSKGGTQQFTATVTGTNSPSTSVTWTIETTDKDAGTTITNGGLLKVAVLETKTTLTVKATSVQDNTNFGEATVTVTAITLPAGFFELGPPVDAWWGTVGIDNNPLADLTFDIFKAAKYLIMKVISVENQNGFGGIQLAVQGDGDSYDWHQADFCTGWNQPTASGGQWDIAYATEDTFYIVFDITTIPGWTNVTGTSATKAKIKLNTFPDQIKVNNAYLVSSSVTLAKPATVFNITNGWAAQTVPELTP